MGSRLHNVVRAVALPAEVFHSDPILSNWEIAAVQRILRDHNSEEILG